MGPNGPHSELIFLDGMVYEGWMGFQFTFVHKDVLIITTTRKMGNNDVF